VFGRTPTDVGAGAAVAAFALARYVAQTFWPWGVVSPLNEMPPRLDPIEARFLASGVVIAVITLALIAGRRRWPAALAAWLCYGLILLPTSGLVPFGAQLTADRYTYVACLGFSYLVAGALLVAWQRRQRGALGTPTWMAVAGLVVVTVAGFAVVTARRVAIWRDSKTLWTYTASVEPGAVIPQVSLGLVFEREGRLADAVRHFWQAAALRPADARIRTDLGRALARQGRLAEAVRELETVRPARSGVRTTIWRKPWPAWIGSPRPSTTTGPRSRSSRGSPKRARAWSGCFRGWGRRPRAPDARPCGSTRWAHQRLGALAQRWGRLVQEVCDG
jgi:predicted RNA-binding protein YlqC (UPF0109 family)